MDTTFLIERPETNALASGRGGIACRSVRFAWRPAGMHVLAAGAKRRAATDGRERKEHLAAGAHATILILRLKNLLSASL